jgi:hypothetical protein
MQKDEGTISTIDTKGNNVLITLDRGHFFIEYNGQREPARINGVDIQGKKIQLISANHQAEITSQEFSTLDPETKQEGIYEVYKAVYLMTHNDMTEELLLIDAAKNIIYTTKKVFSCGNSRHREEWGVIKTSRMLITDLLAFPGHYHNVPTCDRCWHIMEAQELQKKAQLRSTDANGVQHSSPFQYTLGDE